MDNNTLLFRPLLVGSLQLPNRLVRSATAERLVLDTTDTPSPRLAAMYEAIARGGTGTIITGHVYVTSSGQCHNEMCSLADDAMIDHWRAIIAPSQAAGARVIAQINHGGASCDQKLHSVRVSPSGVATNQEGRSRALTSGEIDATIAAFGAAARRAREAGFDGVQLHGAHGYLVSQFLMQATNRRDDAWGGDATRRRAFLLAIIAEARTQVGPDYPLWLKLGVAGTPSNGLPIEEGAAAAAASFAAGVDCIEISHALGMPNNVNPTEPLLLPQAQAVRAACGLDAPLALVNGFRTRVAMEAVLASGVAQLVSLSRPLIAEPALGLNLQQGAERLLCTRCGRCWPTGLGAGIACNNPSVQKKVRARTRTLGA
ncbi:MAG: hypothetical protein GXY52_09260 [Chloroflexi bacterium]|nr:hypothetical protein [Chloroflexota bacterium]